MAIKKVENGYRIDFRPQGGAKRIRRIFKTLGSLVGPVQLINYKQIVAIDHHILALRMMFLPTQTSL